MLQVTFDYDVESFPDKHFPTQRQLGMTLLTRLILLPIVILI